jgi:putative hydrolase of the HAD superfamily
MNQIKHYSFDLWLTLIKSNPTFKKERALYFYRNYNSLNKSIEEVELAFRHIDSMCNSINEATGHNIDAEEMYLMVIYSINNSLDAFKEIDTKKMYFEIEVLILKYSPQIFSSETILCLDKIRQKKDVTLSILSNTAFIKGDTLKKILEKLDIAKYFDFQIYSDQVSFSKPNIEIFKLLLDQINLFRGNNTVTKQEVLHIGDNPNADIFGAESFGIKAFQINSNEKLISNIV